MYRYEELFGRNFPVASNEEQQRIKCLRVGIVGLGALSFVAEYLARLGVQDFLLIDGDEVAPENLNHQHYTLESIGKNKAQALGDYLLKLNPEIHIKVLPILLEEQNFEEIWGLLKDRDVIVDGIDPIPGIDISRKLAQACEENRISYLYPLDVGHGAILLTSASDFLKLTEEGDTPMEKLMNIFQKLGIALPPEVQAIVEKITQGELKYYPQPITSAVTASLLSVATILQIVRGDKPLPFIYYDFVLQKR